MGRDVRFLQPDTQDGADAAPRNTYMIDLIFTAARKAVPVARDRIRPFAPRSVLPGEHRPGVLSREELRRAVAEIVG